MRGWRTIVVASRAKLELKMNYLVIRREEEQMVFLDEVSDLIIEDTSVSLTCALLEALIDRKISVVFCDRKRNPHSQLSALYGSHDTSSRGRSQIRWDADIKKEVWQEIVREKIRKQAQLLESHGLEEAGLLRKYIQEVDPGDASNREGFAAKVYFNALFGKSFSRGEDTPLNAALNYGYGVLLSAVNRAIVSNGYLTQRGINHDNVYNFYNLGCDLMEPFRPIVDSQIIKIGIGEIFASDDKRVIIQFLNEKVLIEYKSQYLSQAIPIYVKSVLDSIEERDISQIRLFDYEF